MDKNTSDDLGLYPHGVRNDKGQWWCDKCNRWEDTILHGSWAEEIAEREGGTVVPLVPESELADLQRVNAILEELVDDARSEQYKANEEAAVLRRALMFGARAYQEKPMGKHSPPAPAKIVAGTYERWLMEGDDCE